jgi:hypothetical protein
MCDTRFRVGFSEQLRNGDAFPPIMISKKPRTNQDNISFDGRPRQQLRIGHLKRFSFYYLVPLFSNT